MADEFGFTKDQEEYQAAVAFRTAAIADGWLCTATYENETTESAASLTREGFNMQLITRRNVGKWSFQASVSIWGPDKLSILVPKVYNWNEIQAGLRRCNSCMKTDVETQRFSFAGRCCANCIQAMRTQHEYPGWDN